MKKITLFLLLFIGVISISIAKEVKPETAKRIAKNMYQQVNKNRDNLKMHLVYTNTSKFNLNIDPSDSDELTLYYVFNAENDNGFVIVSGDDNAIPIIGYATTGSFDNSKLPPNLQQWLEDCKSQLRYIIANDLKATEEISSQWKRLEDGQLLNENRAVTAVNPLLSTKWNQSPHVNDLCPYDEEAGASRGYHAVTGCVATAQAQIMKYWEYPSNGTGFHSYNHSTYGTLSANFASTTYDWSSMPNSVNSANNAVATLMYHCGVASEMGYGPNASATYTLIESDELKERSAEYAYKTYFGYDASTLQGLRRENYTDNAWIQLLKNNLDEGRPIHYSGRGAGGHSFVCDGYDNNDYFHFNWGWGGYADGFFLIDDLNPGSGGTGSGAGTYNNGQKGLFGIQPPPGSTTYDMALYDNIVATPNPVWYGSNFTVHTDIVNWGANQFNGDYCAAIFDESYNFVDYVEILSGKSLEGNSHYTNGLDFTNSGMESVLPGLYYVGIFYRPTGGDWAMFDDGSYNNMISFDVYYYNDIELYQDMVIDCGTNILQNQPFTVTLDILNNGSSTFNGEFSVVLLDLEGYFEETVYTYEVSLPANSFYDDLKFVSNGVNISPGTYLLTTMHKEDGGDWEITGSSYYSNPIYVIMQEETISVDVYESNDVQNDAYNLSLSYSNNNASVTTVGSNLHSGIDEDYYKIEFASGYNYTITARAHDNYNSGNGDTYTCDVSWIYLNGPIWSDTNDDVLEGNIFVSNGGTVYFRVSPYFAGEKGTYLLEMQIARTPSTAVPNILKDTDVTIFPNPTNHSLNIQSVDYSIENCSIFDLSGKLLQKEKKSKMINVSKLQEGAYLLMIETDKGIIRKKFLKTSK